MAGEPKFFSRNFVDSECSVFSDNPASSAALPRLFDRDASLLWKTSGAASDATTVVLEIDFKVGGVALSRTFDTLALLNFNVNSGFVEYNNGSIWVALASLAGNTNPNLVISFGAVTGIAIRITMSATIVPNREKQIGEVLVLSTVFAFGTDKGFSRLSFAPTAVAEVNATLDKGVYVNQLRWAGNRVERFRARFGFTLFAKADYDTMRSLIRMATFTCQLEPVERPDEFFQVTAVPSGASSSYTSVYKAVGYDLDVEVQEV